MSDCELAVRHLLLRLRPIHRALRAAVARQAQAAARLHRAQLVPLCVTDEQVNLSLEDADQMIGGQSFGRQPAELTEEEIALEQRLRRAAKAEGSRLPLDLLAEELELTSFEQEALLICAAAELDCSYHRVFAYVLDDLNRRDPCVELLANLTAETVEVRLARRRVLGPAGRLRRSGLLQAFGEPATGLRTPLRLGAGVLEMLTGVGTEAAGLWREEGDFDPVPRWGPFPPAERSQLQRIGRAVADRSITSVGIWSQDLQAAEEGVRKIAALAGLPIRRLSPERVLDGRRDVGAALRGSLLAAAGAILLLYVDPLHDAVRRDLGQRLAEMLSRCRFPVALVGKEPWRPTCLLSSRGYAEIELPSADCAARRRLWASALPEVNGGTLEELAGRFRMSREQVRAAARLARTLAVVDGNGKPDRVEQKLEAACAAVSRKTPGRLLSVVQPRRGPQDLVLPADQHRQVMEIAHFARVLPRVTDSWGFGRLATGCAGIKSLFTGDPGTGKTLAAEVIAGLLEAPLLKVNIGQTISKWVGETEKNLDEAFQDAAGSHAVLFFDEADALFGRRGQVRHGVDRYANTEVSHLLQRLEDHEGLVILASNLRDNIDPAFTRRFHVVVHFPRPNEADRRRIWQIAFPAQAPLGPQVDLDAVARLDMTGAGIVAAARTAALLAAASGAESITMAHLVQGIARQYRHEARMLTASDLGPYAALLGSSS